MCKNHVLGMGIIIKYRKRFDLGCMMFVFVMGGRLSAAVGFVVAYLYTSELFPTVIRNTAIGTCSTFARVGGVTALLMEGLKNVWPPLSTVIFGLMAITAGILSFKFPETRNDKLPENIMDAMNLGQNVKRNKFGCIVVTN